jgi:hypothetical protein
MYQKERRIKKAAIFVLFLVSSIGLAIFIICRH